MMAKENTSRCRVRHRAQGQERNDCGYDCGVADHEASPQLLGTLVSWRVSFASSWTSFTVATTDHVATTTDDNMWTRVAPECIKSPAGTLMGVNLTPR
jgi:hypothetical protein